MAKEHNILEVRSEFLQEMIGFAAFSTRPFHATRNPAGLPEEPAHQTDGGLSRREGGHLANPAAGVVCQE